MSSRDCFSSAFIFLSRSGGSLAFAISQHIHGKKSSQYPLIHSIVPTSLAYPILRHSSMDRIFFPGFQWLFKFFKKVPRVNFFLLKTGVPFVLVGCGVG